ncbi:hypothetical protein ACQ4PT_034016 [Festuca glaucescens]
METDSSPSPPASSLGHRLRATVCCCFGGDRAQWGRRRVGGGGSGGGKFRYDPLSYALNFDDQGPDGDDYETSIEDFGDGDGGLLIYHGFSSSPPPRSTTRAREAAVAAA